VLELTRADLVADWEAEQHAALTAGGRPPVTQLLARAAHATGVVSAELGRPKGVRIFSCNARGDMISVAV
jgi:hypothetical protein